MGSLSTQTDDLSTYKKTIDLVVKEIDRENITARIWASDPYVWKKEANHLRSISKSLGWLNVAKNMYSHLEELEAFGQEIKGAGIKHVLLLGMGGSSLCPEVLRRTIGSSPGYPELLVLDSTDPDTIASYSARIDLSKTLFIVASKSGTTIEPDSFYKYFFNEVRSVKGDKAAQFFVAITDKDTQLEQVARKEKFRKVFVNPADIGGRYSALSYFGLIPAAVMGIDLREYLYRATLAMESCAGTVQVQFNPAAKLGATLGALAREGRDKLTLITDSTIESLGLWIEQLVAESTGKEHKGILPVCNEPLVEIEAYGKDRVFVVVHSDVLDPKVEREIAAIRAAGHPVIRRDLNGVLDLGAEFFIWELATAVMGHVLAINPFDQPNVQESKDNTVRILTEYKATKSLPQQSAVVTEDGISVFGGEKGSLKSALQSHLTPKGQNDYIALLAYLQETEEHEKLLTEIRQTLLKKYKLATTAGFGPRYLHSTGQYHKGGPANGIFLIITDEDKTDLTVPGEPYSFSILKQAQALGDFHALGSLKKRVIQLNLGKDSVAGLRKIHELISS
jgi:transaldolase / glucose-6-phosphate isomerase